MIVMSLEWVLWRDNHLPSLKNKPLEAIPLGKNLPWSISQKNLEKQDMNSEAIEELETNWVQTNLQWTKNERFHIIE